jgi:hypothetical protein
MNRTSLALRLFACGGLALAAASDAAPAARAAAEPESANREVYFNFLENYRSYYAGREPLCFTAIAPATDGRFGLHLAFASNLPGLKRIEWAEGDGEFRPLPDGAVFIPFEDKHPEAQDKFIRVRPVFSADHTEPAYTVRINWMTRAAFEKAGGFRRRDIVKVTSEPRLNYGTNRPEDWKSFRPDAAETAFAQKQWGHLVAGVASDYEKAKILTKAIVRELRGCGGLPSAMIYGLPTFGKYEAIRAGRSKFACAQYSEIFSKACNAFGVINRWGFNHDNLRNDEVLVELGSSHLVTEIFDRDLNQWIFLDGHAQTLGAFLGEVGPLTLHEFFLAMNQPNRRPHLRVTIYDPEKDTEATVPVDRSGKAYLSYNGWTKGFHTELRSP